MDFTLTDEQQMLREASRALLADRSSPADARAVLESDAQPPKLWDLGAELGWPGLALPEEHGGSAQGLVELALVAEELGRSAARVPFAPSVLVGAAVSLGGSPALQAEVLPALADGSATAAWALLEPGAPWSLAGVALPVQADGDASVLHGRKSLVQDAQVARWLLVTAVVEGAPVCLLVDADSPGVSVRVQQTLDPTRVFCEVTLDQVRVPADRRLALDTAQQQRLLDDAAVLTAADALGAARKLLTMSVEYAKVRQQFGRPIGSFQVIKHKLATMSISVEAAHAATYYAAMAAAAGSDDAPLAAAAAKAYTSEALSALAGEALQVLGGIGFTWEHDLHLYLRRIKVDALLHGDATTWHDRVCSLLEGAAAG